MGERRGLESDKQVSGGKREKAPGRRNAERVGFGGNAQERGWHQGGRSAPVSLFFFSLSLSFSRGGLERKKRNRYPHKSQRLPVTCNEDLSHCQPSTSFSPSVLPRSNRRIPEPGTSAGDEPIEPNPKMELSLFPVHAVTCWRCNRIWISSCPPNPPPLIRLSPSLPRRSEIGNLHSWPTSSPRQTHLK